MPTSAAAQARAPDDVAQVFVQQDGAEEVRGQLLELSAEALTILVDGQRLDVPLAAVARIDSGGDSVRNGALIGALVAGGWCALVCGQGLDNAAFVPVGVAINAVFGGAIGAWIDSMIPGRNTIYRRPAGPTSTRAAGLAYRVRF